MDGLTRKNLLGNQYDRQFLKIFKIIIFSKKNIRIQNLFSEGGQKICRNFYFICVALCKLIIL